MKLHNEFFKNLYEGIMGTDWGVDINKFKEEIIIDVVDILQYLHPVLNKIYHVYFPWEPQTSMTYG